MVLMEFDELNTLGGEWRCYRQINISAFKMIKIHLYFAEKRNEGVDAQEKVNDDGEAARLDN